MAHQSSVKRRAILLRRRGKSLNEIARLLPVAKSTLSLWLRNVALPMRSTKILEKKMSNALVRAQEVLLEKRNVEKAKRMSDSRLILHNVLSHQNESFWQFVAAIIFWCEGGKRHLGM